MKLHRESRNSILFPVARTETAVLASYPALKKSTGSFLTESNVGNRRHRPMEATDGAYRSRSQPSDLDRTANLGVCFYISLSRPRLSLSRPLPQVTSTPNLIPLLLLPPRSDTAPAISRFSPPFLIPSPDSWTPGAGNSRRAHGLDFFQGRPNKPPLFFRPVFVRV